jgi:hypothetical protein
MYLGWLPRLGRGGRRQGGRNGFTRLLSKYRLELLDAVGGRDSRLVCQAEHHNRGSVNFFSYQKIKARQLNRSQSNAADSLQSVIPTVTPVFQNKSKLVEKLGLSAQKLGFTHKKIKLLHISTVLCLSLFK